MSSPPDLRAIARTFTIHGEFLTASPYGNGHINDTYCAQFSQAGAPVRYILQRINSKVFKDPLKLMENMRRVTGHIAARLSAEPDSSRSTLTLIPTREGLPFHRDESGNVWRACLFIEKARTYDTAESERHAFEAARAFGRFQDLLADLPAPRLHETIPD